VLITKSIESKDATANEGLESKTCETPFHKPPMSKQAPQKTKKVAVYDEISRLQTPVPRLKRLVSDN